MKKEFNSFVLFFSLSLMVQTFSTADGFMMNSKAFFGQFPVDLIKTDTDMWVLRVLMYKGAPEVSSCIIFRWL